MLWIYDRENNLIDSLEPITCVLSQKITGEDYLEIETFQDIEKDMRIVRKEQNDYFEYIVQSVEQIKEGQNRQINHINAVTSIVELSMDVVHDVRPQNVSAYQAILRVLGNNPRWSIGKIDDLDIASDNFYRVPQFDALKSIANNWHGELFSTVEIAGNKIIKRKVNMLKQRGQWNGKRFTYSKDIQGVKRTIGERPIFTKVYPYGKGEDGGGRRRTIASINNGKEYIEDVEATNRFGRPDGNGGKVANEYFAIEEDIEDLHELFEFGKSELKRLSEPEISYDIDVVDLSQVSGFEHEGVEIGDTVAVIDESFSPEIRLKARVIELERDLLDPRNSNIKIGNYVKNITDTMRDFTSAFNKVNEQSEVWNRAKIISSNGQIQANFISGLLEEFGSQFSIGGNYFDLDKTTGMTITDKPLDENPTWAMNLGSKGFRIADGKLSNGNWNWRTYGTGKGFVADVINAGVLRGGNVDFDLEAGRLTINGNLGNNQIKVVLDGQDIFSIYSNGKFVGGLMITQDGKAQLVASRLVNTQNAQVYAEVGDIPQLAKLTGHQYTNALALYDGTTNSRGLKPPYFIAYPTYFSNTGTTGFALLDAQGKSYIRSGGNQLLLTAGTDYLGSGANNTGSITVAPSYVGLSAPNSSNLSVGVTSSAALLSSPNNSHTLQVTNSQIAIQTSYGNFDLGYWMSQLGQMQSSINSINRFIQNMSTARVMTGFTDEGDHFSLQYTTAYVPSGY